MCGRIRQSSDRKDIQRRYPFADFSEAVSFPPPRYNAAPTQSLLAIRPTAAGRAEIVPLTWGIVPSWTAELGRMQAPINARSDGVASKPMFRSAFKSKRCVIPVDGFYEWKREGSVKQPFHISAGDGLFSLAAIWDRWERDGKTLETFAVVTTDANELVGRIHDRMPVIIADADLDVWMRGTPKEATALMKPFNPKTMKMYLVSTYVNNARNQGEKCAEAVKS